MIEASAGNAAFACSSMMMRVEVVLLALANARDQKHGHDDESHDEPPPQTRAP